MRRGVSRAVEEAAFEMWRAGRPVVAICEALGLSEGVAYRLVKRRREALGRALGRRNRGARNGERLAAMRAKRAEGWTLARIAEDHGVSKQRVAQILDEKNT